MPFCEKLVRYLEIYSYYLLIKRNFFTSHKNDGKNYAKNIFQQFLFLSTHSYGLLTSLSTQMQWNNIDMIIYIPIMGYILLASIDTIENGSQKKISLL